MQRVKPMTEVLGAATRRDRLLAGDNSTLSVASSLTTRLLLLLIVMITLCASSGCFFVCNGTGRKLIIHHTGPGSAGGTSEVDPFGCALVPHSNLAYSIRTPEGDTVHSGGPLPTYWLTYDGFNSYGSLLPPDMSTNRVVLLCNQSAADILLVPVSSESLVAVRRNVVSDGWRLRAGETQDFLTLASGERSFEVYNPDDTENALAICSIDLTDFDQVIWDGTELICKEAIIIDLVNTSAATVDIIWQEAKGNLGRTTLGPGVSLPLGVPEGEEANFDAEVGGNVVGSCTLNDPMAGHQIVWDGTELADCDPSDPPDPPQTALIDLHNDDPGTTNLGPAWFVIAGGDPFTQGVFVVHGQSGILEVPSGAPVEIQVWDSEAATLYGQCTINDPTDGDSVTWDGTNVTCEDL